MEKEEKALHTCEVTINEKDYASFAKYFKKTMRKTHLPIRNIIIILFMIIMLLIIKDIDVKIGVVIGISIVIIYFSTFGLGKLAEIDYKKLIKKYPDFNYYKVNFYEDYLIIENNRQKVKYNYSEMKTFIETEKNIYLETTVNNKIVFIKKDKCDKKTIEFIEEKFKDIKK